MKRALIVLFCALALSLVEGAETGTIRVFSLEGVRTGRIHGPFAFTTGSTVRLDTGSFRLDVLSASGTFILTDEERGTVFGVYELVPGRIIDAGYSLFTITRIGTARSDIRTPRDERTVPPYRPPAAVPPPVRTAGQESPLPVPTYTVGALFDLANRIAYEWTLDGEDGGSARYIERRGAIFFFSKNVLTLQAGLLADGDWNEEVNDPNASRFQQATLSRGTGWLGAIRLSIPVWQEGRWSARVEGGLEYRRETFSLEYGSWETILAPPSSTNEFSNGVTNGVPDAPTPQRRFVQNDVEATLSETLLELTARIEYRAPSWFWFAGLRSLPWSDTDLQAVIRVEDERFPISFKRRDPVSGFGGIGIRYQDIHGFAELEGGGINALRIGVYVPFF